MQIIRNNSVVDDPWQKLDSEPCPDSGDITVSVERWKQEKNRLSNHNGKLGVRLSPEASVDDIASDLDRLDLIILEFPALTDGRLFSVARILRGRMGYRGEIRASGSFIRDQIFFLSRVGVDSFELDSESDPESAISALAEFSVKYQPSSDTANR